MKKLIIILCILLSLFLAACADVDISYRLSNENVSTIDYSIEIAPGEENVQGYVNSITEYWQSMDFTTTVGQEGEIHTIKGSKSTDSDNKESAAADFCELITSEDSVFTNANFEYLPSFEKDEYSLEAAISLENIIRQNEIQNIPEEEIEFLQKNAKAGSYKISISLPGDIIATNAHEKNENICTWNLQFDEVTKISLKTQKINNENIEYLAQLKKDYDNDVMIFTILGVVGIALILAILLALIIRYTNKKKSKIDEKQF